MIHAKIQAVGKYLPKKILSNFDLEQQLDTSHSWIVERTGIERRHIGDKTETTSFMASEAAKDCLKKAQMSGNDIDMIIAATCSPDHVFPSVACFVQSAISNDKHIPAFDISAACSGFVYAMDIAFQYIRSGVAKNVMVVGSEKMSTTVDWTDRSSCILFGDGAAATILSASDTQGIIGSILHAQCDTEGYLSYPNATTVDERSHVTMKGNDVFKLAVTRMGNIVDAVLDKYKLSRTDVKWLVPHQANKRIISAIAKRLELPLSQVILTVADHGNTSAASIPLALEHAVNTGQIQRGDIMLMEAFGGGMTWGAMLAQY